MLLLRANEDSCREGASASERGWLSGGCCFCVAQARDVAVGSVVPASE